MSAQFKAAAAPDMCFWSNANMNVHVTAAVLSICAQQWGQYYEKEP